MLIYSPQNIGDSWSVGTEFMTGVDVYSWWNLNISSSIYSYKLFVDFENLTKRESQLKLDSRINNTLELSNDFTLKWDLNYKSPSITAQTKQDGYFFSSLALKKDFMDNKWKLTLSYQDIFNSKKYKIKS